MIARALSASSCSDEARRYFAGWCAPRSAAGMPSTSRSCSARGGARPRRAPARPPGGTSGSGPCGRQRRLAPEAARRARPGARLRVGASATRSERRTSSPRRSCASWPTAPRGSGASRTPASGRAAKGTATTSSPRSAAGWRSTARSARGRLGDRADPDGWAAARDEIAATVLARGIRRAPRRFHGPSRHVRPRRRRPAAPDCGLIASTTRG